MKFETFELDYHTKNKRFSRRWKIQIEVFCVVTPCIVMVGYQQFGAPCCIHSVYFCFHLFVELFIDQMPVEWLTHLFPYSGGPQIWISPYMLAILRDLLLV